MNGSVFSALIVGVGGQGIVLAGDILAAAAAAAGWDVKKSEIHGMSRRGGPVFSHVRFGDRVHSPVIPVGEAQAILALEPMELLRWTPWAAPDAVACYLSAPILPVGVAAYPDDLDDEISRLFPRRVRVDLASIRRTVSVKVRNTALLGAMSVFVPLDVTAFEHALDVLSPPGTSGLNRTAFDVGRELAASRRELADVR